MIKKYFFVLAILITAQFLECDNLEILNTGLFALASQKEALHPSVASKIITETNAQCVKTLNSMPHTLKILQHLQEQLNPNTQASALDIALTFTDLILNNPNILHGMYTLTVLTIFLRQTKETADIPFTADQAAITIIKALKPFADKEKRHLIAFWLKIGLGVLIGAVVVISAIKIYQSYTKSPPQKKVQPTELRVEQCREQEVEQYVKQPVEVNSAAENIVTSVAQVEIFQSQPLLNKKTQPKRIRLNMKKIKKLQSKFRTTKTQTSKIEALLDESPDLTTVEELRTKLNQQNATIRSIKRELKQEKFKKLDSQLNQEANTIKKLLKNLEQVEDEKQGANSTVGRLIDNLDAFFDEEDEESYESNVFDEAKKLLAPAAIALNNQIPLVPMGRLIPQGILAAR